MRWQTNFTCNRATFSGLLTACFKIVFQIANRIVVNSKVLEFTSDSNISTMITSSAAVFRLGAVYLAKRVCKSSLNGRYKRFSSITTHPSSVALSCQSNRMLSPLSFSSILERGCLNPRFITQQTPQPNTKQAGAKNQSSKVKLLIIGFGLGALVGLGYVYRKMNLKTIPIANVDSENDLLLLEAPPIDFIAKKVTCLESLKGSVFQEINVCCYIPRCWEKKKWLTYKLHYFNMNRKTSQFKGVAFHIKFFLVSVWLMKMPFL